MLKLASIAAIACGETLVIFSEIYSAKAGGHAAALSVIAKGFFITVPGGLLLICGYVVGYKVFANIWVVSAISITLVLLLEPTLNYIIFRQMPTLGAGIGFLLGAVGFAFALFL